MNQVLDNKYPYLSNFFQTAISQNRLFHSLIFAGSNNLIKYAMALELARQLNCLEDKRENCNCQNCRWIRDNKHPAVMTISKIDNKADASKTVISEEQINSVLDTLVNSSDYHRVFIFCDAQLKSLSIEEEKEYEQFNRVGFKPSQEQTDEKSWYPSGISRSCLSMVAANAMLKSIEEPSDKVTFIFLANNKDDILQTIVSRSQTFYMADTKVMNYQTDFFRNYFSSYPVMQKNKALDFVQTLLKYQIENNLEPKYIIDCIQHYLTELAKVNSNNNLILSKIYRDIQKTEEAKIMLDSHMKEQVVYEDLSFYFVQ